MPRETSCLVLLLGASNFERMLPAAWRALQEACAAPTVLACCGLGRAVCVASVLGAPGLLGRSLPSIGEALRGETAAGWRRARAVCIGDLGNDLAYGVSAEELLTRLEWILAELREDCTVVLLRPPVEGVRRLGPVLFKVLSWVLFPGRRIRRAHLVRELEVLEEGLDELARSDPRCRLLEVPLDWFGLDRIHVRRRHRSELADLVAGALADGANLGSSGCRSSRAGRRVRVRTPPRRRLVPRRWRWTVLGLTVDLGRAQPVHEEESGATLWIC